MKMYLSVQSELSELHQRSKSANPTMGAMLNRSKKGKSINLSLQSDTEWESPCTNDSFISAKRLRWASRMIGVQTGSSSLCFSHSSIDKCQSQHSGRCWGAWRCSLGESDSIWQCAFSPPYPPSCFHPCHLNSPSHPSIPLNQHCLLLVPTCFPFFFTTRLPKDPETLACHFYQLFPLIQF